MIVSLHFDIPPHPYMGNEYTAVCLIALKISTIALESPLRLGAKLPTPRSLILNSPLKTINKSNICTNNSFIYINISFILTNISFIYTFLRGGAKYPPR